ncbi:MAG TPA: outer membrane beta-barrel protein [Planctomycetota bacterium]|nr:outer membrane beta-barrel protein [Planctomycetota bacterium]
MIELVFALLCPVLAVQESAGENSPVVMKFDSDPFHYPDRGADDFPKWSVGFGVDVWTGFGSVFNDLVGPSLRGGYRFDGRWSVALSLFRSDFDFEDPADNLFGQSGTPVSDASIDLFMVSATARWHLLEPAGDFDLYIGGGLGFAAPGDGEAVNLPQVDIEVDGSAGPEIHIVVGGAWRMFGQLHLTAELRLIHSFTEFEATDRLTGQSETEGDWTGYGLGLGVEYRF